jgi:hypothetical protein
MARRAGHLISRRPRTSLVRVSLGREPETGTRKYQNKTIRGSFREAQTYLTYTRETGQIVGRAPRTWLVRVYLGCDAETKKWKYLNKTAHGGLRSAQAHLNPILGERDLGRNLDSSKQTLNQYLFRLTYKVEGIKRIDFRGKLPLAVLDVGSCLCLALPSKIPPPAASFRTSLRRRFLISVAPNRSFY